QPPQADTTSLPSCSLPSSSALLRHAFVFNLPAPTDLHTLSLHDALPIWSSASTASAGTSRRSRNAGKRSRSVSARSAPRSSACRSEEHTSELQSLRHLVCRLLLEKKKHRSAPWTV